MSITDRMLDNRAIAGRRILRFGTSLDEISDLIELARHLQDSGMRYKLAGDHAMAVATYRDLLQVVRRLEEVGALNWPTGLPTQLVQRAIEIEECHGVPPSDLH